MKNLKYLIATAVVTLAIATSHAFGQTVYSTGTQGCCEILDPHYTLIAAPPGVPLGNVYSMNLDPYYVAPLPGTWWINPTGRWEDEPEGDYTFRQTFTLASSAGAMVTGGFAADDNACVSLNGGPTQCTPGGYGGFEQYTPFRFTTGFQAGTNALDFVVHNEMGLLPSSFEPRPQPATRLPYALALEVSVDIENKLHNFGHGTDGTGTQAGLISDAAGNLYGTTYGGGAYGLGTVFELTPQQGGGWTEKKLYNFGHGADGANPEASLISDAAGNLYGTTYGGGAYGLGTVFELSPQADGTWAEKRLRHFGNVLDGQNPRASLIWDAAGNLYGTTVNGGAYGYGTVFELTPNADGTWAEKRLRHFGNVLDGQNPRASLVWDAAGNLYGTTWAGGAYGGGTVFELTPNGDGTWAEKRLRHFGHDGDGQNPAASLIWDTAGNLYGTTVNGGYGDGTVFELSPLADGRWAEKQVHDFNYRGGREGQHPYGSLIWDAAGNLYGTTYGGGIHGNGMVFELSPKEGGGSTERVLYGFNNGTDGARPYAGLIWDAAGNLYSTTSSGGTYGGGVVFKITP